MEKSRSMLYFCRGTKSGKLQEIIQFSSCLLLDGKSGIRYSKMGEWNFPYPLNFIVCGDSFSRGFDICFVCFYLLPLLLSFMISTLNVVFKKCDFAFEWVW